MPKGYSKTPEETSRKKSAGLVGYKQSSEHVVKRFTLKSNVKRSVSRLKIRNTPEVLALMQQYGHPLITKHKNTYRQLNYRCNNPNHPNYKNYGARGIENRFMSLLEFLNYVIFELGATTFEQLEGKEIHRNENDSHYMPGNIVFIPRAEHLAIHGRRR